MGVRAGFLVVAANVFALLGCVPPAPPTTVPMREVRAPRAAHEGRERCLVIVLPGLNNAPEHLLELGFADAIHDANVAADVTIAEAHFGYYAKHSIVDRVDEDLVLPALESGYSKVWLVGISLGGLGALAYGAAHADRLAGIILVSPYIGRGAVLDDVRARGGARAWQRAHADELEHDHESGRGHFWHADDASFYRAVWSFVAAPRRTDGTEVPLYLGYGRYDFLERDQRVLARSIPERRLLLAYGGHRFEVFRDLLRVFAKSGFLQRSCGRASGAAPLREGGEADTAISR